MLIYLQIFAVEPEEAAVLSGKPFGLHKIPGMGAGLIPDVLDTSMYEEVIQGFFKTLYIMNLIPDLNSKNENKI